MSFDPSSSDLYFLAGAGDGTLTPTVARNVVTAEINNGRLYFVTAGSLVYKPAYNSTTFTTVMNSAIAAGTA